MGTANVIELETALKESLEYCRAHPEREFVQYYEPRLAQAKKKWEESVKLSDRHYLQWQDEFIADKIAWKRLGAELRATQKMLHRIGAIGYPTTSLYHWDEEILSALTLKMMSYLEERTDVIDGAAERLDNLKRLLEGAQGEMSEAGVALHEFNRYVLFRAEAMGTLSATLSAFRVSMRRTLGKKNPEYLSIRWPMTLSPDEPVL